MKTYIVERIDNQENTRVIKRYRFLGVVRILFTMNRYKDEEIKITRCID